MQGYQFIHLETYSKKGAPGGSPNGQSRKKNGQRIWTATEVIEEAEREELASEHVPGGRPAPQILPGDVDSFEALRDAYAKASSVQAPAFTVSKNGKKKTVTRKIRDDSRTLYSCVVSLPVSTKDALADPALKAECLDLCDKAMGHETERLAPLGGRMMMGVIHWDEEHVHLHLLALDPSRGTIKHLHPGEAAKAAYLAKQEGLGHDPKVVNRNGNRVYCNAMREWQDEWHEDVFGPAGLLRYGPRRGRLTRAEWLRTTRAAAERKADERRQMDLREGQAALALGWKKLGEENAEHLAILVETEAEIEGARDANATEATRLKDRSEALDTREKSLDGREGELVAATAREAEADAGLAAIEGLVGDLLEVEETDGGPLLKGRPGAKNQPSWSALAARIRRAPQKAVGIARTVATGLAALRQRAWDQGLADGRKVAEAEAKALREALDPALSVGARIAQIAKGFAARLSPGDREAMTSQIDAALTKGVQVRTSDGLAQRRGPSGPVANRRPPAGGGSPGSEIA